MAKISEKWKKTEKLESFIKIWQKMKKKFEIWLKYDQKTKNGICSLYIVPFQ